MATTTTGADTYISNNVIVAEDWTDSDTERKTRILNTANRVLATEFSNYTIPENAVYEYCAALATAFNDTNKLAQQGVAGYSITGVASFTYTQGGQKTMAAMIPKASLDYISADPANADLPKVSGRKLGRTVLY